MKKFAVLSVLSFFSLVLTLAAPAIGQADDKTIISEYCTNHNDLGLSHGGCVAYFVTHNVVPHDASVCKNENIQRLLGVSNQGQCVKKLGEMRK